MQNTYSDDVKWSKDVLGLAFFKQTLTLLRPQLFQNCWKWSVNPHISSSPLDRPLSTRAWSRLPARMMLWVCEKIDACTLRRVCCVQASRNATPAWRNRGNSQVNSRGSYTTQWSWEGYSAWLTRHCITLLRPQLFQNCWKWSVNPHISSSPLDRPLSTRAWSRLPARMMLWVCEKIDACTLRRVCCVQASRNATPAWRNRGNSQVNSRGSYTTQWSWEG